MSDPNEVELDIEYVTDQDEWDDLLRNQNDSYNDDFYDDDD
jgi:hypothetical protein